MRVLHVLVTVPLFAALVCLVGCPKQTVSTPVASPPVTAPPAASESAPAPTGAAKPAAEGNFKLTSAAFAEGSRLPTKYTGDGADVSPPLSWTKPPDGTKEIAVTCDDPDAPGGKFTHWVLFGLAPDATGLKEGIPKTATAKTPSLKQGQNDFGKPGYSGPAPPPGATHHYNFTVYALGKKLSLEPGATMAKVQSAIQGSILAQSTLAGTYSR